MGLSGFAVETATSVEVVAAWVAPKSVVSAVTASPGWQVIFEGYLPKSCRARLDVVHIVSASGLTSRVRLWDTDEDEAVPGAVSSTAVEITRSLGGMVDLTGGRTYQIQAECTGATGDDKFSVVLSATITD